MNVLVETKIEYTNQMINIVAPFVHEGIQSIYREAVKVSRSGEELKSFQVCLKQIVTWPKTIIASEKERIFNESNCAQLLEDLLRAIIKSNIMILTNTPPDKKHELKIQFTLEFDNFLHQIYIESAKAFYQNPFLYFHNNPPIEITRNQREALNIIKECIREAIRKMLPLNLILRAYLGEAYTESSVAKAEKEIADIEKAVTEQDKTRLTTLLEQENEHKQYQLKSDIQIVKGGTLSKRDNRASPKTNIADLYKDGKTINLNDTQQGVIIMQDSTGKKMEAYKSTMPTQYGKGNVTTNNVPPSSNKRISIPPNNTSESYMPKDKNIAIFETYSNANGNDFKEIGKETAAAANNEFNF